MEVIVSLIVGFALGFGVGICLIVPRSIDRAFQIKVLQERLKKDGE